MKTSQTNTISPLFLLLAFLAAVNAAAATFLSNVTLGTILTWVLAVLLGVCSIRKGFLTSKPVRAVKAILLVLFCLLLAGSVLLYVGGSMDTADFEEDAVIVLGTGVRGEEPTESLKRRLDAALSYHQQNPQALIVVTGGMGDDENISEALAMEKYLLKAGLPQELIIKEDRATSTQENFIFSREILDGLLEADHRIVYISNDFHIYRAGLYAEQYGYEDAAHFHGSTPWYMVVPNGLRETVVILKTWILE